MARFNQVQIKRNCSECKEAVQLSVQFRYGHLDALRYRVGDKIKWGPFDNKGDPSYIHVIVDGFSRCPKCAKITGFIIDIYLNEIKEVTVAKVDSDNFEESGFTILEEV